jgi:uncharacterized protein
MSKVYSESKSKTNDKKLLVSEQKEWYKKTVRCGDSHDCLIEAYNTRINQLKSISPSLQQNVETDKSEFIAEKQAEVTKIDESISFKGIKFGMKAAEIARLGGGTTSNGCMSAIRNSTDVLLHGGAAWTYGGINSWDAHCVEDESKENQVPGTSGFYALKALLIKHGMGFDPDNQYSVDELIEIFSKVFGRFQTESRIVKNGFGQEFEKKKAVATANGAMIEIMDDMTGKDHDKYIWVNIFSYDYLKKAAYWENQKNNKKLNNSKNDF